MNDLDLIIEPDELEPYLHNPGVVIVDLCKAKQYALMHIPGAHFIEYVDIVHIDKPVMGLLPSGAQISIVLSKLGITPDTHVVAYDDEGGGCASRFLWTLHVFGHDKTSLLNGGIFSWANEEHAVDTKVPVPKLSDYGVKNTNRYTADREYIRNNLENDNIALLDARSEPEYSGEKKFALKGGHIPGAIHFEWSSAMDPSKNLRLLPVEQIQSKLDQLGLNKNKEIICYCQSHHRSAFSYFMLRALGYEKVKGYPGSWSDWGNQLDTPVE
jgi:thiosulfate/3-mercaptopyruvate sulfurtransferase